MCEALNPFSAYPEISILLRINANLNHSIREGRRPNSVGKCFSCKGL